MSDYSNLSAVQERQFEVHGGTPTRGDRTAFRPVPAEFIIAACVSEQQSIFLGENWSMCLYYKGFRVKGHAQLLWMELHLTATGCHLSDLPYGNIHTAASATRHKWTHPALNDHAAHSHSRRETFCGCFSLCVAEQYILQQKCMNKWIGSAVLSYRNTMIGLQLSSATRYTDPERQRHSSQRHRQTDRQQYDANSRSYCVKDCILWGFT